jgi:chromosome segregation ATPase
MFTIRSLSPDAQRLAFSVRHAVLFLGLLLLTFGAPRAAADSASDAETRLRDTLRSTILQLRDAQNQIATLQGTQADSDAKNKELTDQLALMKKHSIDDKAVADTTIAALTAKAADQGAEIAKLKDLLGKWQAAYRQVRDDAGVAEAERAKLADDKLVLQRRVDYLEAKNVALFSLGNEILGRYEDFSLGNALSEKEPFVGVTRVKLENLVQDYQDKLLDQRAVNP